MYMHLMVFSMGNSMRNVLNETKCVSGISSRRKSVTLESFCMTLACSQCGLSEVVCDRRTSNMAKVSFMSICFFVFVSRQCACFDANFGAHVWKPFLVYFKGLGIV